MKLMKYATFGAMLLASSALYAQQVSPTGGLNTPPGQYMNGMNQSVFSENSPSIGFFEQNMNPGVQAAGTTQATATVLGAKTNIITGGSGGVQLPNVNRFATILLVNRSGASITVYPSTNATVESVAGTASAVNAGVTLANNSSATYLPQSATAWLVR